MLVAQLQNQDPLNPSDGTQFLSQLTEINSFEQLLYIRQDLDQISGQNTPTSGSGATSGSSTPPSARAPIPAQTIIACGQEVVKAPWVTWEMCCTNAHTTDPPLARNRARR